ncbi:MAG: DUF1552 domain-containing protein [Gemmataceae bacterium]|nr:DUF1552 domain-containing protein [Gemmataceae bacterium]
MSIKSSRRDIIKDITLGAGATLLSPVLLQLAAHARGDASAISKRIVFVVQGNGMNPNHLVPIGVKRRPDGKDGKPNNDNLIELDLKDLELNAALNPLAPFKERLTLIQGLSGRIALSDHSANHGALGCYPANKGPMAQTIDLALGEALPGIMPHLGLGLMNKPDMMMNYNFSASGAGKAVPIQCSPELAFKALFGSVAEGSGKDAFDRKTNLLDFMAEDVKKSRNALATEEKHKFDQYLEAFESLRDRQAKVDSIRDSLKANAPKLNHRFKNPTETNRLEAQFEIAAASLIVGLTNVVTLVSGGGGQHYISYPELGIPVDGHHYGHGGGVEGKNYEDCFRTVRQYHAKLIAGLASKLNAVKEGDGTMLDNTLIVYLSDSGDAHHPNLYEWPVVMLGNLGGKLKKGGRYLQLPQYQSAKHRTMANFYLTLLEAVGKPRKKFGIMDPGLKDIDQTGIVSNLLA